MKFQWLVVGLAALSAACGGISTPSSNTTDTFTATLTVGGYNSHPFAASRNGEFTMKFTAVAPDATALIGVGYGQMSSTLCVPFQGYTNVARLNGPTPLSGSVQKGNYCIAVFDTGSLTQAETYTMTVSHP